MKAIAIDFETANERRDSACAVGLAWIEDGRVVRREYALVRPPEMRFSPGNVRVHGLRAHDVADAPFLPDAIAPFLADLATQPILAHNAGFDIGVLAAGLAAHGKAVPAFRYLCTRDIAKRAWPGENSYGLAAMAARIGLGFRHHHAGEDAFACAQVALAAASDHGTGRISELVHGLGLFLRQSGGSASHGGTAPRSGYAPRGAAPGIWRGREAVQPGRLAYAVRGSDGSRYDIVGAFAGTGYALRCTCMAGLNRRRCRHVTALLDGEVSDLLSDNTWDVEKLRAIVQAIGLDAIQPAERVAA